MAITTIPEVREEIQENINTNNQRAITGQVLQDTLIDMLDTVDEVKANTTGYYEGMSVGLADNLISPDTTPDTASWIYRSTAGNKDVSSGFATIQGMKGNTIVWNQLLGEGTFVDMGLPSGNLWATSNIDVTQPNKFAASPFQYEGSFFSWGNIEGHNPISTSAFDYNWGSINSQEPWYDGQPYGDTAGAGLTTNIPVGETYDAARANLGAPWYIPQSEDFQELVNNCIFINADGVEIPSDTTDKRVTVNGIVGLYLQSKTNGNRLFFSASGDGAGSSWYGRGASGYYWSASFYSSRVALYLVFVSGGVNPQDYNSRCYGFAVRAIAKTSDTIITDPNGHKYYAKNKQNVFDLTKMFGSDANIASALGITTAEIMTSAGVTAFERWLQGNIGPKEYYAYDEGSLLSFNPTDIQTTGFNQYDNSKQTDNVHVLADQKYRIKGTYSGLTYSDGTNVTVTDGYFTPDRVDRLTLSGGNDVDTCVHLSWSGYRDGVGDYERYWSVNTDLSWIRTLEHNGKVLFPNGLCRAGEVYDEISGGKAIKRIGVVDLGTLDWRSEEEGALHANYNARLSDIVDWRNTSVVGPIISGGGYTVVPRDAFNGSTAAISKSVCTNQKYIIFTQDSYASAATFKTAMSGVLLYYELATQIVVDLPEGINLNYKMDDFGTEEFINTTAASDTPGLCKPTLVDIGYQTNLRDKIRRLDDNYVSLNLQENSESKKLTARQNIDAASTSGSYPQMTVGNLIADVDTPREFTFEETGGGGTVVGNGYADVKKIEGNTVVWNQMFSANLSSKTESGVTFTVNRDGGISVSGTATNTVLFYLQYTLVLNHIYLMKGCPAGGNSNTYCIRTYGQGADYIDSGSGIVFKALYAKPCYIHVGSGTVIDTSIIFKPNIFDLTKMFGAGNEPTTVEEFEHLFPIEYAPYCEGRLVSLGGYGIKWNQLVQNGNFAFKGWWTVTGDYTVSNNVATATSSTTISLFITPNIIIPNHKYYISAVVNQNLTNNPEFRINFQTSTGAGLTNHTYSTTPSTNTKITDIILSENTAARMSFGYYNTFTPGESYQISNIQIIDLTEMFGPGSEPTLEEFESMFGTEYSPYDEGTEMNILEKMNLQDDLSVKSTGFNQWDEEWENGTINASTGENQTTFGYSRSTNYIAIFPNTVYYCKKNTGIITYVYWYDANKNYISRGDVFITQGSGNPFTSPANAYYMRLSWGNTINDDICINLSDPSKNGAYLPYTTSTQDLSWIYDLEYTPEGSTTSEKLFPYGLLSAGSVHDEVTDTGAIKRIGVVDLGTLNFIKRNSGWFSATLLTPDSEMNSIPNILCDKYKTITPSQSYNGTVDAGVSSGAAVLFNNCVFVRDNNHENIPTQQDNWLSGVILYYELATPITVTFTSPKDLGYNVQSGGTEQLLPSNPVGTGPVTAPIIESVNYPLDAVGTLTNLPKNYISVESMDSFTTALGNAMNLNITKTWDSTNNKWTFSVTSRS